MTSDEHLPHGREGLPELAEPPGALASMGPAQLPVESLNAPRIAGYRLLARYADSGPHATYLGLKEDPLVHPRRAILKFVPRSDEHYDSRSRTLLDEALALSVLEHPNIVRLLDVDENETGAYLALELIDGVDLERLMRRLKAQDAPLTVDHVSFIVLEVLRGLEHAHAASSADGTPLNIVHRDVNPTNILVANTGHVRLSDFGAVKMKDRFQARTAPGMVKGKFRFLAPEYISSQIADATVDVYSVGVTLFEALTGEPWTTERDAMKVMKRIVSDGLPYEALDRARVPYELIGIVALATEREPLRRFESAAAMASTLETWLVQRGSYIAPSLLAQHMKEALATP